MYESKDGEMLERSIRHAWKAGESTYAAAQRNSKFSWLRAHATKFLAGRQCTVPKT